MNNLQSGVNSSQLSPQNFRNSSQSGSVQGARQSSGLQQSGSNAALLNNGDNRTQLRVVEGNQQSVLGSSSNITASTSQPLEVPQQASNLYVPILLVAISLIATIYLFRKYSRLSTAIENTNSDINT